MTNKKDGWKIFIGVAFFYLLATIIYAIGTHISSIYNGFAIWYSIFLRELPYSFIGISVWILITCATFSYLFNEAETTELEDMNLDWFMIFVTATMFGMISMCVLFLT